MMNRRDFIKLITAAVAGGAVLDVERLLWVPKPMIVVPALSHQLTLADWAKRLDPNQNVNAIIDLLSQSNDILADIVWCQDVGGQ